MNTLSSLDSLSGGAGNDRLDIVLAASATPSAITGIETISVSSAAATTLNLLNASGYTSLINSGSTATVTVSNIREVGAALTVADTDNGASFAYTATAVAGTADSVSLTVADATTGDITVTGAVETLNVTSNGTANTADIKSGATTLNISGSGNITLTDTAAGFVGVSATTVDASTLTGKLTYTSDAASAVTVTGGSAADTITFTETAAKSNRRSPFRLVRIP